MLVLAMSKENSEFLYVARTARQVSRASAEKICKIANENKFLFSCYPGYVWHVHEVDQSDSAFDYAQSQKFTIRGGIVKSVVY